MRIDVHGREGLGELPVVDPKGSAGLAPPGSLREWFDRTVSGSHRTVSAHRFGSSNGFDPTVSALPNLISVTMLRQSQDLRPLKPLVEENVHIGVEHQGVQDPYHWNLKNAPLLVRIW